MMRFFGVREGYKKEIVMFEMTDFTWSQWLVLMVAAFLQGMSKGGVPGLTVLAIPFVAMVIPGKASTGLVLPMLVVGDLFALAYWRRSVCVRDLMRAFPWALVGVLVGWRLLGRINDAWMQPVVGATVLLILGIQVYRKLRKDNANAKTNEGTRQAAIRRHGFAVFMGSLGGITTMLANAAGPVIGAYLLSLRLSKETFLGTCAWFFFLLNWVKVPFMVDQGMITRGSLVTNALMVPALVVGVVCGIFVARRVKQKTFEWMVIVLAGLASLKLLF